ncbi:hypothetical protein IRZ71_20675 [Flavobacterium sp. ANB]|uniref:hypothetical protein n=1 Tax=unclassified Flavobacterium TaxID=196869 RepID=UPI0012B9604E|nr:MULTISPECIES: hypothetical protein [unclassified Flavobacterium]MBF4518777.1 hypothetical protein [Flavobacterium sp. ANB]MTD71510.1 hypothetical protein [Flavobacterium sp. LC2016-13]
MNSDTQNIGIGTTIIADDIPIVFQASFNSTTLYIEVKSCKFDLVETVKERFNSLNVILPEGSSTLSVAKFSGAISRTDQNKKPNPNGEYRLIKFAGEMEKITIPIPILSDISIDKAFFYYLYLSPSAANSQSNFKDQIIFLGCNLSVKQNTKLFEVLTNATLKAAYFLSNNASVIYFAFSGKINVGKIIEAIFGVTSLNLTIDVQSSGIFRIAKTAAKKKIPGKDGAPDTTVPEITYLDALRQIASLQNKSEGPVGDSDVTKYMPSTFPLAEKTIIENGTQLTKVGIRAGNEIDTDFTAQFTEVFSGEDVTGICFWVMINFNQISLFGSLITIGYKKEQVNSLILYGFKTENKKSGIPQPVTAAYFYAQLPAITFLNFLTLEGLKGRQGILFKYTSNKNQYELSGSITFTAFEKSFVFGGDLLVNDDKLVATIDITVDSPNKNINKPLGMTGINFGKLYLCVNKTFAKKAEGIQPEVKEKLDLAIGGYIDFNFSGVGLQLQGNVVFEDKEACLVLVSLNATPALTLNNFVREVIQKPWEWVDQITKQIGFISGTMYYLNVPESVKDKKNYTFSYTNPIQLDQPQNLDGATDGGIANALTVFKPGYHIHADLLLFEKYVFVIDLSVQTDGITLSGSYGGTYENGKITSAKVITAFFISLESPVLSIGTVGGNNFEISISNLKLFGTTIGDKIIAKYQNGFFSGTYSLNNPKFGFEWQWTKKQGSGGFSITRIDGIDIKELESIAALVQKLNSMTGSGGCESIVDKMFEGLKSSFSPALQEGKSPTDNGNGTMLMPLKINYTFSVGDTTIMSDSIRMDLNVKMPTSIGGLPGAMIETLGSNMGSIVEQLLGSPTFYKAIALEMAKKGAAKLAARMLCRAAEEVAKDLAQALSKALAEGLITAGLEGLVELGAVITAVFAAGIAGAVGGLLGILKKVWDEIKKIFGGDDGKQEAQDKLNAIKAPVQQLIASLNSSLNKMAATIQVKSLEAGINDQGDYMLNWNFPSPSADLGENPHIVYKLNFLGREIGSGDIPSKIPSTGFMSMQSTSYHRAWSEMLQEDPDFRMNASIQTSITGYTFLTREAENNLQSTIDTLKEIGGSLDGALAFSEELHEFVIKMKGYNTNGLTSEVVYATQTGTDTQFRVGKAVIGINTRIT